MKKYSLAFLVLLLTALLCACKAEDSGGFFDYQDRIKSVKGVLLQDGSSYGICAYFEKNENGERRMRRIEYSSPESISGLSFTLEGENITAELCGVRISDSWFERDDVFRIVSLFSLREEDIYSIKTGKGDSTAASGKNEREVWHVTTDSDGVPLEIVYESTEGDCTFKVEEMIFFEKNENDSQTHSDHGGMVGK